MRVAETMARVSQRRDVVILGSTGSIGTQALEVVRANPDRFRVVAMTAGGSQEQLFDQQANTAQGTVPIFQLDMWEHAFYLDYLNVKADYVKAVWNIANWQNVAQRLDAACEKTSGLLVLS